MKKKLLALALCFAMMLSVLPMGVFAAAEEDSGSNKAICLVQDGTAANIKGAQASNVYFGTYLQSKNETTGEYNKDPIKWRVLANANGELFLLSDQNLDAKSYDLSIEFDYYVGWEVYTMRSWLNGYNASQNMAHIDYSTDNFLNTAFAADEQNAIATTEVVNNQNPDYPGSWIKTDSTFDRVFLLSLDEVQNTDYGFDSNDSRKSTNTAYVAKSGSHIVDEADEWWLRTPGRNDYYETSVNSTGSISKTGEVMNGFSRGVRPAFNLNLDSVLFTSAAAGGKDGSLGSLGKINAYDGSDWKMTLHDASRDGFAVTETTASAASGSTVTLNYTGAATGKNEYISAMLVNSAGEAAYYGRLAQPAQADGTVTVTIPNNLEPGNYTLKVFNEQYNGDYKTDYAGAFDEVTLTVTGHDYELITKLSDSPLTYTAECLSCGAYNEAYEVPTRKYRHDGFAISKDFDEGDYIKPNTDIVLYDAPAMFGYNLKVYINDELVHDSQDDYTTPCCLRCVDATNTKLYFEPACLFVRANCTDPKTCIYCGMTEGEALGHTWADATCTTPKICTVCGEIPDPTLGHDWIAATCTEPKTCSLCGATEGEALGHSFTARGELVSAADCTHSAVYVAKCSRCDETNGTLEVGSPLGHDYDVQYIVKEATETTPAEYYAVCRLCGDVTDNYIPKKASDSVTLTDIKVGDILKRGSTFNHDYGNVLSNARCHIYVNGAKVTSVDYKKQWTAPECLICTKIEKNRLTGSDVSFESYCDYIDATCTHPEICIYCGDTKGDALGHTFENGVCTECGIAQFEFSSISLVLSGELGLNFYTKVNDIESVKDGYMLFEIGNKGETQTVNFSDATLCDDGRYMFRCNVNALQMADTITVTFHFGDTVVGPRTTSVAGYIDKVIENHKGDDTDPTVKLAKAIVNYGHYAQLGQQEVRDFVLGEDYAAINNLSDVAIVNAENLAQHKPTKTGSVDNITKVTRSLSLDHGTDINLYFTVTGEYIPTVTVTDKNGNTVDFTLEKRADGRYQLVIPQIAAHQLGDMYTVTVDGTMTINVSALSYAYSVLASDKSDAQKLCVSALYEYYIAAIAYQNGFSFGEWVAEIPATCTENGVKGHYFCSRFKMNFDADGKFIADLTIPALGHSFSDGWTYDGIGHWHKAACEHTDLKSDYANHTFGEAYTGEDGHEYIKCSECGFVGIMSTHGLAFEYDSRKDGYICTGIGTAETTDIVIGYLYNDGYKPIIGVGDRAFENNWDLTSVVLSDNLTVIGDSAFFDCRSLSSISLPSKLTTIGSHAFFGCVNLRDVVLPDSLTNIGSRPFDKHLIRCNMYDGGYYLGSESNPYFALIDADKNITDFVIADGTKILSGNVFYNYGNISSMVVPSSVKTICSSAIRIISVDKVFYKGTEAEWETIVVERYNDDLMNAPRYYYSETQPTTEGYFWHYENNVPTIW